MDYLHLTEIFHAFDQLHQYPCNFSVTHRRTAFDSFIQITAQAQLCDNIAIPIREQRLVKLENMRMTHGLQYANFLKDE